MIPKIEIYNIEKTIFNKLKYIWKDYIVKPITSFFNYIQRKLL